MNQIPNIEDTDNTEVEEMIAFIEVDGVGVALFQNEGGLKLTVSGSKEFIKEIPAHHQLQKAREEQLAKTKGLISDTQNVELAEQHEEYVAGFQDACSLLWTKVDRYHSELDQPTPSINRIFQVPPGFRYIRYNPILNRMEASHDAKNWVYDFNHSELDQDKQ